MQRKEKKGNKDQKAQRINGAPSIVKRDIHDHKIYTINHLISKESHVVKLKTYDNVLIDLERLIMPCGLVRVPIIRLFIEDQ